jgi:hypothetical protein
LASSLRSIYASLHADFAYRLQIADPISGIAGQCSRARVGPCSIVHIQSSRFIRCKSVRGFVYLTEDGALHELR